MEVKTMKQCKYCKNEGEFEPSIRKVLCAKHKYLSIEKYLGRELQALTPEELSYDGYIH